MEERTIFDRFHEALDVEPPAGAFDRMRIQLTAAPVVLKRRPGFQPRFTKMGFRVVAALAAAAVVIAAIITLSLHRTTVSEVQGNQVPDIKPYQALVARDYATAIASTSNHCNNVSDTQCKQALERVFPTLQSWLEDLNNFDTPARFKLIDTMLRHHLAQAVAEGQDAIAAQQAGNSALFDAAMTAHFSERGLVDDISAAVAQTQSVTAAAYRSVVQDQLGQFTACTPCGQYSGPSAVSCSGAAQMLNCVTDVVSVDAQIYSFESAVVQNAAPSSLAARDLNLQTDLVNSDSAMIAMINAGLAGDSSGFTSARASLQAAMSAARADEAAAQNG